VWRERVDFSWSAVYRLAEWSAEGMLAQPQGALPTIDWQDLEAPGRSRFAPLP